MHNVWRVLASVCFCVLVASAASAQTATATAVSTATPTTTPTSTATFTPLPIAPPVRAGISAVEALLSATAPTPGAPIDVHGYGSGAAQIVVGACSGSFTLNVEGRLVGDGSGTWSTLASYSKSDIAANTSKIVSITPFPLGWVRLNPSAVSSCVLLGTGAFRP